MSLLINLLVYSAVLGSILYGIFGHFGGSKKFAWLGAVVGVLLGVYLAYPSIVLLPLTFWSQFVYSYENLDTTDFWAPTNGTFILYGSMFLYLGIAALAVLRKGMELRYRS